MTVNTDENFMVGECAMRHENGNCLPAGGFCTANRNICEALRNAWRMGYEHALKEQYKSHEVCETLHTPEKHGSP